MWTTRGTKGPVDDALSSYDAPFDEEAEVSVDVRCIKADELQEWAAFVADNPSATGFHAPGWFSILSDAFTVKPLFLCARDGEGHMRGVLPLFRTRSLFFGDFISSLEDGHCATDAQAASALAQGAIGISAEVGSGCLVYKANFMGAALAGADWQVETLRTVVDTNQTVDRLFASLDSNTRRKVRKANREGYRVHATEHLKDFHRIYAEHLHRLGTPCFGLKVFESMRRHLRTQLGFYAIERGDKLCGGMMCLKAPQEWTSLYVAVEPEAQQHYASYLLYWNVIEAAASCGVARLNLGRSQAGSGVHHFKRTWTDNDVFTTTSIIGPTASRLRRRLEKPTSQFGIARRLWRLLPTPVAQTAGIYLRRRLPFV